MGLGARYPRPPRSPSIVVSPATVQDDAAARANVLGELCYTIPGSDLAGDRRRATLFAATYLGAATA